MTDTAKMTFESLAGDQSPAELAALSAAEGHASPESAASAYAAACVDTFPEENWTPAAVAEAYAVLLDALSFVDPWPVPAGERFVALVDEGEGRETLVYFDDFTEPTIPVGTLPVRGLKSASGYGPEPSNRRLRLAR